ncbi:DMT family transporter [Pseudoalteromonas piratica]|uniref:Multidrug transporter n=1 Tax=Pseudoalteromonas piratica TaxID=1348114 RepID=A0A0A7EC61_9GAMM|nr:DMT family transporter [Pseudoalteromonas piratica]AIY64159.1 multidrug transporter [Pseudoalteromonas piratica]
MLWVFFTVLAAFMQTFRNGLQSKLSKHVSTLGVTLARFLFATPIALIYIIVLYQYKPVEIPTFNSQFYTYVAVAAGMQILATALMVVLFKQQNFAIGAGLAKSEALVAAILGALLFGSKLTLLGWFGVLIGALAVFVLSGLKFSQGFKLKTVLIGLSCGSAFALTSLSVREASIALNLPFPHSAAWVLLWVLSIQTLILLIHITVKEKHTLSKLKLHFPTTFAISVTSCIGSIGWFSAMSLQYVAYVKTLGQIEVLFTILLAIFWLKQKPSKNELLGLILIAFAAILVMWQ